MGTSVAPVHDRQQVRGEGLTYPTVPNCRDIRSSSAAISGIWFLIVGMSAGLGFEIGRDVAAKCAFVIIALDVFEMALEELFVCTFEQDVKAEWLSVQRHGRVTALGEDTSDVEERVLDSTHAATSAAR